MKIFRYKILSVFILSFVISHTFAQNQIIDADSITKSLLPSTSKDLAVETSNDENATEGILTRGFAPVSDGSINLHSVNFNFDSSNLTDQAKLQLEQLAIALQSKSLEQHSFELIGHTDAKGSDEYNLYLSNRRAESVLNYLTRNYGVKTDRIEAYGMGEQSLLDSNNPNSSQNRRVEIITK